MEPENIVKLLQQRSLIGALEAEYEVAYSEFWANINKGNIKDAEQELSKTLQAVHKLFNRLMKASGHPKTIEFIKANK